MTAIPEVTPSPRITVAIPVYNRRKLLERAVVSVLRQGIDALDLVIVDNCSTDGTWEFIADFVASRPDLPVRCVRNQENLGVFGNFSKCVQEVRGKYLRILCSDDCLADGALVKELEIIEAHPSTVLLSSRAVTVDERGKFRKYRIGEVMAPGIYNRETAVQEILWVMSIEGENPLNFPSGILLDREAALAAGSFDSSLRTAADVDFWLRVLRFGDLAVTEVTACEIMFHDSQQHNEFFYSGDTVSDLFEIVRRRSRELGALRSPVVRNFAGRCLWLSFRLALGRRHRAYARNYWHLAFGQGLSIFAVGLGLLSHICVRGRRLLLGGYTTRHKPAALGSFPSLSHSSAVGQTVNSGGLD